LASDDLLSSPTLAALDRRIDALEQGGGGGGALVRAQVDFAFDGAGLADPSGAAFFDAPAGGTYLASFVSVRTLWNGSGTPTVMFGPADALDAGAGSGVLASFPLDFGDNADYAPGVDRAAAGDAALLLPPMIFHGGPFNLAVRKADNSVDDSTAGEGTLTVLYVA
jgi:hypothetical protein